MARRASVLLTLPLCMAACGYVGVELRAASDAEASGEPDADLLDAEVTEQDPDLSDGGVELDAEADALVDARSETQVSDYCMEIPALLSAPLIDGKLDGQLQLVPLVVQAWTSSAPLPSTHSAEMAVGWRPDGLYVFVHVRDTNLLPPPEAGDIWGGDGVELYADNDGRYAMAGDYDNPGSVQIIVAAPSAEQTSAQRAVRFRDTRLLGPWMDSTFGTFPVDDGYVLEALMQGSSIDVPDWALAEGGQVGFNLSINVSIASAQGDAGTPSQGYRLGQYFLASGTGNCPGGHPYCTTGSFCNPLLVP